MPTTIWQVDFYRRPLQNEAGQPLWELLVCDAARAIEFSAFCPQSDANTTWLKQQLLQVASNQSGLPDRLQVFRPQCLSLIESVGQSLGVSVEATRRTLTLKQWLQERATVYPTLPGFTHQPYQPTQLEQPPPIPLPENLWGDRWRFATLAAGDLEPAFRHRPIPIREMPDALLPLNLGLASATLIPGIVIDGGRQSMRLARWLQQNQPVALTYIPGAPDGLILEAGLIDRWVVATFADQDVATAAHLYEQRKQAAQGLHFLLVQPDDSGMTYSGFWLLQPG